MTIYRKLDRVTVEFKDREGVPSALIVESFDDSSYAEIAVDEDGLTFDLLVFSQDQQNKAGAYHFKSLEEWELVFMRRDHQDGQGVKNKQEFGPVGKAIMTTLLLAFLTPVVWVIWDATIRWVQR
ncbi:hypothetical protein SEA_SPARCETUS_72 [Microbacterium phage Sparcetus]|nr:hypothetical protein SEA_SPARCETUS_72 [Microbacterium phage Sparcetus]